MFSMFSVLGDSFSAQKEIFVFDLRGKRKEERKRPRPGEGSRTLIRHLLGALSPNYADYTAMPFDSLFSTTEVSA